MRIRWELGEEFKHSVLFALDTRGLSVPPKKFIIWAGGLFIQSLFSRKRQLTVFGNSSIRVIMASVSVD